MAGTPGNPVFIVFVCFAMLVAFTKADRMQDSELSKGEWTDSSSERTRRTMRDCGDARGENRPELKHPYSADEVDGIFKHIKTRLSDLKTPKKRFGRDPYQRHVQTGRFRRGGKNKQERETKLDTFQAF